MSDVQQTRITFRSVDPYGKGAWWMLIGSRSTRYAIDPRDLRFAVIELLSTFPPGMVSVQRLAGYDFLITGPVGAVVIMTPGDDDVVVERLT